MYLGDVGIEYIITYGKISIEYLMVEKGLSVYTR